MTPYKINRIITNLMSNSKIFFIIYSLCVNRFLLNKSIWQLANERPNSPPRRAMRIEGAGDDVITWKLCLTLGHA